MQIYYLSNNFNHYTPFLVYRGSYFTVDFTNLMISPTWRPLAIHYPSRFKIRSGIFKQAIQFVYLSWSCSLYLTDVTYTQSHMFSL